MSAGALMPSAEPLRDVMARTDKAMQTMREVEEAITATAQGLRPTAQQLPPAIEGRGAGSPTLDFTKGFDGGYTIAFHMATEDHERAFAVLAALQPFLAIQEDNQ